MGEKSFDMLADVYRLRVLNMALNDRPVGRKFRDLTELEHLSALCGGIASGLACVAASSVTPKGRDAMIEYIIECLHHGREQADRRADARPPTETQE